MNYNGRNLYKVLVIYPDAAKAISEDRARKGLPEIPIENLKYGAEEVSIIVNELGARLLPGARATIHGLLDILAEGWDIIWIITHGEERGWYLSDGIVNVSELTSLIRSSGTFLTVMNTCSSYEVAKRAAIELGTAFICTLTEVPDRQAYIAGVLFAQKLSEGYDYVTAYQLSEPGQEHPYVLIEGRGITMPERPSFSDNRRGEGIDTQTLRKFIRSVEELDHIINGSDRLGLPSLKDVVWAMRDDVKVIKDKLRDIEKFQLEIERRQKIRNIYFWGMGIIIVILIAIVAVLAIRLGATI